MIGGWSGFVATILSPITAKRQGLSLGGIVATYTIAFVFIRPQLQCVLCIAHRSGASSPRGCGVHFVHMRLVAEPFPHTLGAILGHAFTFALPFENFRGRHVARFVHDFAVHHERGDADVSKRRKVQADQTWFSCSRDHPRPFAKFSHAPMR